MMTTTLPSPVYKRGNIVLVLFPKSDLRTAKPRPALVIQANDLKTGLPQVIVAMITSKMFRANHPSRVIVGVSTPEGIDRVIGNLPMTEVDKALRHTLSL